jgi:hypothetical protein
VQVEPTGRPRKSRVSPDGLDIRSPDPPVSCEDIRPDALVSDTLRKLARDFNMERRFRPKQQLRELRPFERGYWLLDCSSWEESLKWAAWAFLTNYIGDGQAGWGVWCRRNEDFTWIRLYCWGSVVGYMYLVLYLASRRKILHTGSSWLGGDGQAVIVMDREAT